MNKRILIPITLVLSSCGQQFPCANQLYLGNYHTADNNSFISLTDSCTGSKTVGSCEQDFFIENLYEPSFHKLKLTITKNNGAANCHPINESKICDFKKNPNSLELDCGAGNVVFLK